MTKETAVQKAAERCDARAEVLRQRGRFDATLGRMWSAERYGALPEQRAAVDGAVRGEFFRLRELEEEELRSMLSPETYAAIRRRAR